MKDRRKSLERGGERGGGGRRSHLSACRTEHPLPDARRFLNCIFMLARISKLRKKDERRGPRKMERREESSLLSPRLEKKPLPAPPVLVH